MSPKPTAAKADVWLGGIGVVAGDCPDVVARQRNGDLRSVLLVNVVDAYLAQLVRRLAAAKAQRTEVAVQVGESLVRHVETGDSSVVLKFLPDGFVYGPADSPP